MLQHTIETHLQHMQAAMIQARLAYEANEVPIGAVLVDSRTDQIIAQSYNQTIKNNDPTAHAEINVIRMVCRHEMAQRIPEYDLYVTLEPCPMCAAAISFARIRHIYFGATDAKSGGLISGPNLIEHPTLHHKMACTGGLLAEECGQILKDFFKERR